MLVSWQFSGPYGVTKYSSGWRKDVVDQCLAKLEFAVFYFEFDAQDYTEMEILQRA